MRRARRRSDAPAHRHEAAQFLVVNGGATAPAWHTLVAADMTDLTSATTGITKVGTVTTGVWNAGVIPGQYGGTGVNNASKTITLGGSLTTSGAFNTTLTVTADTNVTLPTSGTLVNDRRDDARVALVGRRRLRHQRRVHGDDDRRDRLYGRRRRREHHGQHGHRRHADRPDRRHRIVGRRHSIGWRRDHHGRRPVGLGERHHGHGRQHNHRTLGGITTLTATTIGGTLSTAAQPNITSTGVLAALHATWLVVDSGGITVTQAAR
jgi:hypothetical protein